MKPKQMLKIYTQEKDPAVKDRILLNVLVERDGKSISGAARFLGRVPSWGIKWHHRYQEAGMEGLKTHPRSGRPPRIPRKIMKTIKKKVRKKVYVTGEDVLDLHCSIFGCFHRFPSGVKLG